MGGIIQSWVTPWGLIRHYWVLAKLLLTTIANIIFLLKLKLIGYLAEVAAQKMIAPSDLRQLRTELVFHAGGGRLVLLLITVLSVFKPWGKLGLENINNRGSPSDAYCE